MIILNIHKILRIVELYLWMEKKYTYYSVLINDVDVKQQKGVGTYGF